MARGALGKLRRQAFHFLEEPTIRLQLVGRLFHPYWRWRFHGFGGRSIVSKPIWLRGAHKIAIGEDTIILRSWLSVERSAWRRPGPVLQIGDRAAIGPNCRIVAGESVVIEDDVGISSSCLVIDTKHRMDGPHDQIALNPVSTKPVRIGRGSGLGERVSVLQGSEIGRHCVIGTNSVVDGHIPDYSVAVGAPARVIGRTRDPEASAGV